VAETAAGWVTAGKLLARRRPHLVPVYDGVVKCGRGAAIVVACTPRGVDRPSHEGRERLTELRIQARVPAR
jgi:hypothetical protein